MMLILAPVSFSKSGARRCSGSAICGPVKVIRLTVTPSKSPAEAGFGAVPASNAAVAAAAAKRLILFGFILVLPWLAAACWRPLIGSWTRSGGRLIRLARRRCLSDILVFAMTSSMKLNEAHAWPTPWLIHRRLLHDEGRSDNYRP